MAALVDVRVFEHFRRMMARFDALCGRVEAGFAKLPEAEGLAEVNAVVLLERKREVAPAIPDARIREAKRRNGVAKRY